MLSGICLTQVTQLVAQNFHQHDLAAQVLHGDFLAFERGEGDIRRGLGRTPHEPAANAGGHRNDQDMRDFLHLMGMA